MDATDTPKDESTELTELAQLAGHYFQALVKNGLNDQLAHELVRDWHTRRMYTPPANPATESTARDTANAVKSLAPRAVS